MSEKKDEPIVDIQQTISKTERYFEDNKKSILIIVGVVVGLILAYVAYEKLFVEPAEAEAQQELFWPERYFEKDSFRLALDGDGTHQGFIDIADQYGSTPSGNLASYYAGVCLLNLGRYEEAIEYLEDFDAKDDMLGPVATAAIGDAHMELGRVDEAIDHYVKAANMFKNEFTTPIFLMKAGRAYEDQGNFKDALKMYEQIKADYPETREGKEIDKFIAYAKAKAGIE
ncbi:MAG: tetratricopeptide repeat protein [Bacteroidota bacterium]